MFNFFTEQNIIMPLMSLELLKFPSLCLQYFKTITFVCELYPEKICALNPDLQKSLVASLELGLTTVGVDTVFSLCCDFVQVLCTYMLRFHVKDVPMYEELRPFLKVTNHLAAFCRSLLYRSSNVLAASVSIGLLGIYNLRLLCGSSI